MKYLGNPQSGSLADKTASHNRAGQYLRNRRTPVVPTRTPKQGILRGRFGAVSAAWQTLTAAAQAAWTSFAAAYPVVDALGQSIVLTGHQYFVGVNTALLNAGQSIIPTTPTNTTIQPVTGVLGRAYGDGSVVILNDNLLAGDFILYAASSIKSGGVAFNRQFSQFGVAASDHFGCDISEGYDAQYGVASGGKNIFVKPTPVNSSGMNTPGAVYRLGVVTGSPLGAPTLVNTAGVLSFTGADPATGEVYLFVDNGNGSADAVEHVTAVAAAGTFTTMAVSGGRYWARSSDGVDISIRSNVIIG